jgi:hypothetical protein
LILLRFVDRYRIHVSIVPTIYLFDKLGYSNISGLGERVTPRIAFWKIALEYSSHDFAFRLK